MSPARTAIPLCLLAALAASGCGERQPGAAAPVHDNVPGPGLAAAPAQAPVATPAAPAAPTSLAAPVDDAFAREESGWRVSFRLALPALPESSARKLHRACEAWLFQGLVVPRGSFGETAQEAHRLLIADNPHVGAADVWYADRAVVTTRLGAGWLALSRSDSSFAGGAHGNAKLEGLVVQVDEARALTLEEIVPVDRQAALRRLLAQELRRLRHLPETGPITSEVASDDDLPIPLPIIGDAGARFVWNPYEIAPYSDGAFEVALPAERLRPLLSRDPW